MSKTEARAWRRPALQFPTGITLSFSKLKSNPSASVSTKKKALMADPSERFRTTKDLTLAEKGPFVLLEFSVRHLWVTWDVLTIRIGGIPTVDERVWHGDDDRQLLPQEGREGRACTESGRPLLDVDVTDQSSWTLANRRSSMWVTESRFFSAM